MSIITLENMEFHAFHGCLEHEKTIGNTFLVTVSVELDTSAAAKSDNLVDALNYQLIYNVVKEQMEIPSDLIEHVSQRILNRLAAMFPQLKTIQVKLSKLQPPLGGKVEKVSIELNYKR